MIDVKDLRIGNYINADYLEGHFVVFAIAQASCDFIVDGMLCESYEKNLQPIPITHEWLEKFGFELKEKCYEIKHGVGIHSVYFGEYLQYRFSSLINASHLVHSIRYVHELQNLIYVLTGQELTIGGGE